MSLNLPDEIGRLAGAALADAVRCPSNRMCADCVFRNGTFTNGCLQTVADAATCLASPREEGVFRCAHRGMHPMPLCGGYIHALSDRLPIPADESSEVILLPDRQEAS